MIVIALAIGLSVLLRPCFHDCISVDFLRCSPDCTQAVGSVTLTDFNTTVLANLRYNATLLRDQSKAARMSGATLLAEGHSVQVTESNI